MAKNNVFDCFIATDKTGKKHKIVFRALKKNDTKKALAFINKATAQADFLALQSRQSFAQEKKWVLSTIEKVKKKQMFYVVVETNGKIIGTAQAGKNPKDAFSHIASFGIALLEKFTGLGIGTRLAETVIAGAKSIGVLLLESGYFESNKRSAGLHKKLGFKKYGYLPKGARLKDKRFDGHVLVYKFLKKF